MNLMAQYLTRPRMLLSVGTCVLLILTLYMLNTKGPARAVGYVPPTSVLPSYEGTSNIPYCRPREDGQAFAAEQDDHDGEEAARLKHEQSLSLDTVPVSAIKSYIQGHLDSLQQGFDPQADEELLGIKIYDTVYLPTYTKQLLNIYEKYLKVPHIPNPSYLPLVKSRLSLSPPIAPLPPRPKIITTTDAHKEQVPWQFERWADIMSDWEIRKFEDADMEGWMSRMFGGTLAEQIWSRLPRTVLKTDIFRYFLLLVEGGIYTDSDTAPIIHADEWGYPNTGRTDNMLIQLSRVLSLSNDPYQSPFHHDETQDDGDGQYDSSTENQGEIADRVKATDPNQGEDNIAGYDPQMDRPGEEVFDRRRDQGREPHQQQSKVEDGGHLGKPSLVVSVESDAIEFGWDNWREVGLARADQIVQWTIMARPGHPVFLDAIRKTLETSLEVEQRQKEADEAGKTYMPPSALEWTGPGVFTDAVMRYLLTRYGFQPRELLHVKTPVRIGDVL